MMRWGAYLQRVEEGGRLRWLSAQVIVLSRQQPPKVNSAGIIGMRMQPMAGAELGGEPADLGLRGQIADQELGLRRGARRRSAGDHRGPRPASRAISTSVRIGFKPTKLPPRQLSVRR